MDKFPILFGTAAVVFTGGAVLVFVPPVLRWSRGRAEALADWIDDGIDRVFDWFRRGGDAVLDLIEGDQIDWDYAAANAGSVVSLKQPIGQCPECFGQPGGNLRAEIALLRANASAGRAELIELRHLGALKTDALKEAAALYAARGVELAEALREIETLRRERSMRPKSRAVTTAAADLAGEARPRRTPKLRAVPGAAMGDA